MSRARALNRRVFLASSAAVASGVALQGAAPANAATATKGGGAASPRAPDVDVRQAARHDPSEATLAEAVVLMRRGKPTATDLTQAYPERIERCDATYQAYAEVTGTRPSRRRGRRTGAPPVSCAAPLSASSGHHNSPLSRSPNRSKSVVPPPVGRAGRHEGADHDLRVRHFESFGSVEFH